MMTKHKATEIDKTIVRCVTFVMTVSTIMVATAIAWLVNEWITGTRLDNAIVHLARNVTRTIGNVLAVDPIIAAILIPFVIFSALVIGIVFFIRATNE